MKNLTTHFIIATFFLAGAAQAGSETCHEGGQAVAGHMCIHKKPADGKCIAPTYQHNRLNKDACFSCQLDSNWNQGNFACEPK